MAYEYITKYSSPTFTPRAQVPNVYGQARTIKSITIHHWGSRGQQFQNVVNFLCSTAPTSAHYVVEAGKVACIVDPENAAWHSGNATGNATSVGIECRPEATDGDYATVAELIRELRAVYGDLLLVPHKQWFNTACPGKWDLIRLDKLARQGGSTVKPAAVKPAASPKPKPKPAAKPKPKPKPKAEKIVWRMDAGDNLAKIVRYYNGPTAAQIIKANPFMGRATVPLGTVVTIPGKLEWLVERGDSWEKIARYYAVSVAHLKAKNPKIKTLHPGQLLRIQ